VTGGTKRGPALPAADLARDPTSVQLQQLRERLSVHADKLPPDLYDELQELIAQAQADVSGTRACNMHERWRAACDEIAQGKTRETAFEDAATRLAGTPAECGPDMVKKDFLAVQRARRGRLLPPYHRRDDEIYLARVGSAAALAFWIDRTPAPSAG
jgi:hypothetical protein